MDDFETRSTEGEATEPVLGIDDEAVSVNAARTSVGSRDARWGFFLFGLTTASFVVFELVIGQTLNESEIAAWAYGRSLVLVVSTFALKGVDQALLRRQVSFKALRKPLLIQLSVLGAASLIPAWIVLGPRDAVLVYVSTISLGFLSGTGGFLRSDLRISGSILAINGWRTIILVVALLSLLLLQTFSPLSILTVILVLAAAFYWVTVGTSSQTASVSNYRFRDLRALSNHFWMTNIVALGFIYADQLILNFDGQTEASANFFLYASVVLPIPLFVAGFAANILNPWLRSAGERLRSTWARLAMIYFVGSLITVVAGMFAGVALGETLGRFATGLDVSLLLGLGALSLGRLLYMPASGVVGVFGSTSDLKVSAVGGALSIVGIFGIYFIFSRQLQVPAIDAIVLATVAGVVFRVAIAAFLALRLLLDPGRPLVVDTLGGASSAQARA